NPLFQVLLVLQNTPHRPVKSSLNPIVVETDAGVAKFDLSLYLEETEATLRGRWEFNTDLFDSTTIDRWHGHWQNLLAGIVADPECRVGNLSLRSAGERNQLLIDWNDTEVEFPIDDCVHRIFEEQARQTPEADAVIGERNRWSYRVLNERANRI